MAETLLDVRGMDKSSGYELLRAQFDAVCEGINDHVAIMATMACILHHGFGHLWTGFYRRTAPAQLLVGPYQGTMGCLEIAFGRGVCGTAAAERRTIVVADVNTFPGHIACDARSRSEIVVPVLDTSGNVIAVLDIDSDALGTFDEVDRRHLESWVAVFARTT